jgi:hypothetical protein
MTRELQHHIVVAHWRRDAAERQRRRRTLATIWLLVGGLYAAIVACSVVVQTRETGAIAELSASHVAAAP